MAKRHIQDTIEFTLSAEETVVNKTVRINATIVGMISSETSEQTLRDAIFKVMRKFIDTDWQFSNMIRAGHQSSMEQLTLTATARVPESENYALDRRREEAGRDLEGMNIVAAQADTSPTATQIEETQRKLRVALITKAKNELRVLNEATGDTYRLGAVTYGQGFDTMASNRPQMSQSMVMAGSAKTQYGSGFDASDDGIGNAVKLTMQATVELRISR